MGAPTKCMQTLWGWGDERWIDGSLAGLGNSEGEERRNRVQQEFDSVLHFVGI